MTELIDPKALKEYIDDCKYCDNCPKKGMRCVEDCELPDFLTAQWERIIDEQPIIEAEPVRHGKWVANKWGALVCSECNWCAPTIETGCLASRHIAYDRSKYCWNCGAKMDVLGKILPTL